MHVNVIGILAGSLSPREPARRLDFHTIFNKIHAISTVRILKTISRVFAGRVKLDFYSSKM
jgi:hypothetical protein